MANERAYTTRNTGTKEKPVWERWFAKTVADAVLMSDRNGETKTIVDYVNEKIAELIGGAPATMDTLKEIADYIAEHQDVADAMNAAIGNKADKTTASETEDGLMSKADYIKLKNIDESANRYEHPETHPASMISEDEKHQFCTALERAKLENMPEIFFGTEVPETASPGSLFFLLENH